jgi:palmitoyltransferase ZDHHC9/14/18
MAKRVYQVWKGSNKFFLCGRLIFGPDVRSLVVTVFLIVIPVVIFCVFVAGKLLHNFPGYNSGYAILVVTIVYTVYVLVLLLLTSARDPGIVPRAPHPPEPEDIFDSANSPAEWAGGQTPRMRLPRTKDVIVNDVTVKVKYCDTCMLYRPPRCSHCSICNNCVERFDHHCPWVGQCIGQRNYRFFFMFVSSCTLLCIYIFAMSALYIKFLMDDDKHTIWQAMRHTPASIVLMIYTFITVWFVGGLTLFHLYLISINQTTYENFRYRCDNKVNPYNEGIITNFSAIFCVNIKPSQNNFRAKVQQEASVQTRVIPQSTDTRDVIGDLAAKVSIDLEAGRKAAMRDEFDPEREGHEELHSRKSNGPDTVMDIKEGYEDAFTRAIGRPLSLEGSEARSGSHPRHSSWGRKSGSWEITPDLPALPPGDKALPGNKGVAGTARPEDKSS